MKQHTRRLSRITISTALLGTLGLAGTPGVWLPVATAAAPARPTVTATAPARPPATATKKEIEAGEKAAAEFEKSPKIKLLDGGKDATAKALLDKLNTMAKTLGEVSERPGIKYTVKVVDDKDMNAFTLPNGHIYIYRGLIDAMGSDDEMAAVLAHEIGHNAKMHAVRGEAKAKKLSWVSIAAMVAALAGGRNGANMAQFSQYLLVGVMNGYGVTYEKEADAAAVAQMVKTTYNPSALVTLMERLSREEKQHPEVEPGIFRTHPPSEERAAATIATIKAAGRTFTPRAVVGGREAKVLEAKDRVAVQFNNVTLIEFTTIPPAGATPKASAKERADQVAQRVNQLLRDNLKLYEISVAGDATGASLLARGAEIARITPADAALQGKTPLACAETWRDNFGRMFWREALHGGL